MWTACPTGPSSSHEVASPIDARVRLVSWNIDTTGRSPSSRISGILGNISSLSATNLIDVILLQEVSRVALETILNSGFVRESYLISDVDSSQWRGHNPRFGSVTLVRRGSPLFTAGSVYRIHYPSHMSRDALCCDLHIRRLSDVDTKLIRIINVHLDSLPITPPLRPTQLSVCVDHLRAAGTGCVAGDFNAILPADARLAQELGLTDAWEAGGGDESGGHTWGTQLVELFPPGRLDRAVTRGCFEAVDVQVLPCGEVATGSDRISRDGPQEFWSYHCGLFMELRLTGAKRDGAF